MEIKLKKETQQNVSVIMYLLKKRTMFQKERFPTVVVHSWGK